MAPHGHATPILSASGGPERGPPFLAFVTDAASAAALKALAARRGWSEDAVQPGGAAQAAEYLKSHPAPETLLVEVPSAEAAPELLDRLADACSPGVNVIVAGTVNEYSFYTWLKGAGVSDYLLEPVTEEAVEACLAKIGATAAGPREDVKRRGRVIAVTGSRGGAGATTVAVNIAWALANHHLHSTVLMDFDPQQGTAALELDILPGRGLRDALEKPERIDALFMDRMMVKCSDHLAILAAEESLDQTVHAQEAAADRLIGEARLRHDFLVIDLPRALTPFARRALAQADTALVVTELHLAGLRDALRLHDLFRDALKIAPPAFVANRTGLAPKHEMPKGEFEKGLGGKIAFSIPFEPACYGAGDAGKVLVESAKTSAAAKALRAIASSFLDGDETADDASTKRRGVFSLLKRKG